MYSKPHNNNTHYIFVSDELVDVLDVSDENKREEHNYDL